MTAFTLPWVRRCFCGLMIGGICCTVFLPSSTEFLPSATRGKPDETGPPPKTPADAKLEEERLEVVTKIAYRSRVKNRIMQHVISGQWPVRQAADFFRTLDEADPNFVWAARCLPGNSPEERYCGAIMAMVEDPELGLDRGQIRETKARLENQLRLRLGDGGKRHLSDAHQ